MLMQSTFYQFTVKSILAGILIGLGCVIYVASPINYVGSFLFSLALLTIMVKGLYLYTGKVATGPSAPLSASSICLYSMAWPVVQQPTSSHLLAST